MEFAVWRRLSGSVLIAVIAGIAVPSLFGADRFESLEADGVVYRNVVVRSQNASSLIVMHSGGLASIPFEKLPVSIQEQYGYSGESDESRRADLERIRRRQIIESQTRLEKLRQKEEESRLSQSTAGAGQALQLFGAPPRVQHEVDLRPQFREFGISIRNQGRRPSCSIHAIVGALEFLEGRRLRQAENLSEDYLYWATLKTLGRYDQSDQWEVSESLDADAGFQLLEVFQALRAYGIPNSEEASELGRNAQSGDLEAPSQEIIQKARVRSEIRAFAIPGREKNILLGNIVHALNSGEPVVVGMGWPSYRSIRKTAYLDGQSPRENYGHAVTLVGYRSPTKRLEDITFVFRNSWGVKWGAGGYGYVRYNYIVKNLYNAFVLESNNS